MGWDSGSKQLPLTATSLFRGEEKLTFIGPIDATSTRTIVRATPTYYEQICQSDINDEPAQQIIITSPEEGSCSSQTAAVLIFPLYEKIPLPHYSSI